MESDFFILKLYLDCRKPKGSFSGFKIRLLFYPKPVGILIISFVVWPLRGGFFGDLLHCAGRCRFFFPGCEAYRSNYGDPLRTVCLRYPRKSAVPKYHCDSFPWSRPNWEIKIEMDPAASYQNLYKLISEAFFMP
jgi:hypothetical protein